MIKTLYDEKQKNAKKVYKRINTFLRTRPTDP